MSDPRPIWFTRPDLLRALAPELLCELLVRFPAFLAAAGLDLDDLGTNEKRFGAWWGQFEGCGWFEQATPEQVETFLRDFAQVRQVIARIETELAAKESRVK
jgi:hypothetical protein